MVRSHSAQATAHSSFARSSSCCCSAFPVSAILGTATGRVCAIFAGSTEHRFQLSRILTNDVQLQGSSSRFCGCEKLPLQWLEHVGISLTPRRATSRLPSTKICVTTQIVRKRNIVLYMHMFISLYRSVHGRSYRAGHSQGRLCSSLVQLPGTRAPRSPGTLARQGSLSKVRLES